MTDAPPPQPAPQAAPKGGGDTVLELENIHTYYGSIHALKGISIVVEPDTWGTLVQDCEVCCNPWAVKITRDRYGDVDIQVEKAD